MKGICLYLLIVCLASWQGANAKNEIVPDQEIDKVYVIFKTHLDVGFTELGSKVVDTYNNKFIPAALDLSEKLLADSTLQLSYPWSCGSWLVWNFLERSSEEDQKRMEEAIRRGDIAWHAMPFTMQVELCDSSLMSAALGLSAQLDRRFGKQTIAAKITDVPGVTRGVIPVLKRHGIRLLHVGTNPGAAVARLPEVFRWQAPDGSAVNVIYQSDYGKPLRIPGTNTIAVLEFTHDNHGPHSLDRLKSIYAGLKQKYPSAQIIPASLNEVALEVSKIENELPVVTQEWGDTWAYGIASDAKKVAELRELIRLRNQWIAQGRLKAFSEMDIQFCVPLLLMTEHTCGLDVKWYLRNYDKYQFDRYPDFLNSQEAKYIERAWNEKRAFADEALSKLTPDLRYEAMQALVDLAPSRCANAGFKKYHSGMKLETPLLRIAFDVEKGSLCHLEEKRTGRVWADQTHTWGSFAYQHYSGKDFADFIKAYCPKNPEGWMIADYGKPGLDKLVQQNTIWAYATEGIYMKKTKENTVVLVRQQLTEEAYGAPRSVEILYTFSHHSTDIDIEVNWFDKPKNRLPEAVWFSFLPEGRDYVVTMDKQGDQIDAGDVVSNGARKIHGVTGDVTFINKEKQCSFESLDAPLIAFNERNLMLFDNKLVDPESGVHFCLLNTLWGTNYPQWFGDDMKFRFKIKLK